MPGIFRASGRLKPGLRTGRKNKMSLSDLAVSQGQIGGWECATLSFPYQHLAPARGCWFPDAILHGKRSSRPRSRAVQGFATAGFSVRLFSSLRLVVAPPACQPGQDTPVMFPRLNHLVSGQPPLLTVRSPGTTGLASSLSSCVSLTVRRCLFLTSPAVGSFSRNLPSLVVFPTRPLFLSAFRRFSQGGFPY